MLAQHLGASLAAEEAATGVNYDWWNEFLAQAAGVGQSFVPSIIGFAAVLKNLSGRGRGRGCRRDRSGCISANVVSMFLLGGVMDRLARDRAIGAGGFFAACGVYSFRFIRLGLVSFAAYWILSWGIHPWLFDYLLPRLTRPHRRADRVFLPLGGVRLLRPRAVREHDLRLRKGSCRR